MVMQYQFYPWTHAELAQEIRGKLGLPVDTPRRIEAGTMERFEHWVREPKKVEVSTSKVERLLERFEAGRRTAGSAPM